MNEVRLEIYRNRVEWLEARREGVGGSEAGTILGLNPWRSPLRVFAEKTGIEGVEQEQNLSMRLGNLLEPTIAMLYEEQEGVPLADLGDFTLLWSTKSPFAFTTLDRIRRSHPRLGPGPVEFKKTETNMTKYWNDGPPAHVVAQCQQQLYCSDEYAIAEFGAPFYTVQVPVIFGLSRFEIFEVYRDDDFIKKMIRVEEDFMRRVRGRIPPQVDSGAPDVKRILEKIHPKHVEDKSVVFGGEWLALLDERDNYAEHRKLAEKEEERIKNRFRQEMGDAEIGIFSDGRSATYRNTKSGSRTLRLPVAEQPKGGK